MLLNHNLLKSKPGDDVAILARARTLTALQRLDSGRKGRLLIFLHEAELIGFDDSNGKTHDPIIKLVGADLSNADLSNADLSGVTLYRANLSRDVLSGANLSAANLNGADLSGANLSAANLSAANPNGAGLSGDDLSTANLSAANLSSVQNLTQQQLDQVYSCKNAILPSGLTCHHDQL